LGEIADDLKVLLEQKSYELGIVLEQCEIMADHIHLFINGNTSISISKIVQQLKGFSSRKLRQKYPKLMTLPGLWTGSYYCETVGHISKETIRKYIKNQKLQTNADS
jgi:putative transposase